jgi:AraC-like DNA-binding protein
MASKLGRDLRGVLEESDRSRNSARKSKERRERACTIERVLHARKLFDRDGLSIHDVRCRHAAGRGDAELYAGTPALVLVRRGCFVRSADGRESVLDPTLAYGMVPEQEHRYDHPHGEGDDCTALFFDPRMLAPLWGGSPDLPAGPLPTPPSLDLQHRRLLALARRHHDPHDVFERAVALAADLLAGVDEQRVDSGRPGTAALHRRLVDGVREALVVRPDTSLPELSRELAVSPHHLSRIFRTHTGETIARHRMRLRVREALERLARGERELARLARDVGFVDQSYLCRVVRAETGATPAALRELLQ